MPLHYLTVQDILWINLQVTKKVQHFNYARLEEGTFYQYAYGQSNTLVPQAGRFVSGFLKMHPFGSGNEATAFVGVLAFLMINGMHVKLKDEAAYDWLHTFQQSGVDAGAAVAEIAEEDPHHHASLSPQVRSTVAQVMEQFPQTIGRLLENARAATVA